jgi:uncharacterized membrane protein AbrB (regulator of aidB expression)
MALNSGLRPPLHMNWEFDKARLIESLLMGVLALYAILHLPVPTRRVALVLALLGVGLAASTLLSLLPGVATLWVSFYLIWVLACSRP